MKTPSLLSRGVAIHIGCVAAGLAMGIIVWQAVRPSSQQASAPDAAEEESRRRSSGRSRERAHERQDGTELLKQIAPHVFHRPAGGNRQQRSMTFATYLQDNAGRLLKAADELPPADDVAAAAMASFDKLSGRRGEGGGAFTPEDLEEFKVINSRLIHWLRKDPAAALQYLSTKTSSNIDTMSPIFAVMKEKGVEAAIGLWKDSNPPLSGNFGYVLSTLVASEGDVAQLTVLQQSLPRDQWNRIKNQISNAWPFEKADALVDYAISQNSPGVLSALAMRNGKEGADWLMKQLASDSLDPAFKQAIMASQEYRQMMRTNSHLPLEMRVDALAAENPQHDRETVGLMVGGGDVTKALDNAAKDWRFAFRNGKATFEEVYQAVAGDLPDLANASPDAIRLQIFKELAEENGPAAMQALDDTPEPDRWTLALKPTQWMFYNVDPQKFYDYLQEIPHQDPVHHQARLESWVWHSQSNLNLYSRDYVDWVKAMPEGIDREMAAIGILRAVGKDNTVLRPEVEALVKSPDLRARMDAPPPVPRK